MAHEVETMAWTKQVPWHGLGFEVSDDLSADEMLTAAGLDWSVSKRPLYFPKQNLDHVELKLVPTKYALTRDSDETLLDIVGETYKPVQNRDAFEFFKRFVDQGGMKMDTAGSLRSGQFIWGLAKIEDAFNVGNNEEDRIEGYLLLTQPHRFGFSMVAALTPIRVVCMNTMRMALGDSMKGKGEGVFRMPHNRSFDEEVKKAAETALGLAKQSMGQLQEIANDFAQVRIGRDDLITYFHNVANVDIEEGQDDPEKFTRTIKTLLEAVDQAPGSQLKTAEGTLWGAYNAVTFVADHVRGNDDNRLASTWFGTGAGMKRRALELAVDFAKTA